LILVIYAPDKVSKGDLFNQVEHIKTDRSSEDLLFQVMLDWGVDLSLPIRKETIEGKEVFFVNDDDLVACFDKGINEALIKALAAKAPLRVVFRDDGFGSGSDSDSVKINVEQIFKQLAPATDIKAI
jgi:adenine-specific DNA-methyltransferase